MQIDPQAIYALHDHVLLAEFENAGILFDLRSRRCLELNRTGVQVIGWLNGRDTFGQIIARMAEDYGQSETRLQNDLESFIAMLAERNLVDEKKIAPSQSQG